MLTPYTPKEYARKVQEMSPECKVRHRVRLGAERDKAVRDSAPTLQAVRPFDWEQDRPTEFALNGPSERRRLRSFENGAGI